jgi:hypothetical protein
MDHALTSTPRSSAHTWRGDEFATPQSHAHASAWRKIILWSVGAYVMLNAGFQMVRIPPIGTGIPIGEIVLVVSLLSTNIFATLTRMAKEVWLLPVLAWWALSLLRVIYDVPSGGAWAFRDAAQAIESLYLIVGFWLVNKPERMHYFLRWLKSLLPWLGVYGLLMPFAYKLQTYSPHLPGMAEDTSNALFFQIINTPEMLVWVSFWLLIDHPLRTKTLSARNLWAALLLALGVGLAQSRTIYIEVLVIGAALILLRKKFAARWGAILLFGVFAIGFITVAGIQIKGRMDRTVSLSFIEQHFAAIGGHAESEALEGAASGVPQRYDWWANILDQLKSSPSKMVFGLGYGVPLTDFHGNNGALVREPHSSYMSVLGRLGISGLTAWILMQFALYASWWRSYRLSLRMGWTQVQTNLLLLFIFELLILLDAMGEDSLEKPFYIIPYYLFFGVVLGYGRYLREMAAGSQAERVRLLDESHFSES